MPFTAMFYTLLLLVLGCYFIGFLVGMWIYTSDVRRIPVKRTLINFLFGLIAIVAVLFIGIYG